MKSRSVSSSLDKMAAAASLQCLTVVRLFAASMFYDALGDMLFWSY